MKNCRKYNTYNAATLGKSTFLLSMFLKANCVPRAALRPEQLSIHLSENSHRVIHIYNLTKLLLYAVLVSYKRIPHSIVLLVTVT